MVIYLRYQALFILQVAYSWPDKWILGLDFLPLFDIKPVCGLLDMEFLPEDHVDVFLIRTFLQPSGQMPSDSTQLIEIK